MPHRYIFLLVVYYMYIVTSNGTKISPNSKANDDGNLVVTIPDGIILGKKAETVGNGSIYYAYQGIPYATAPLGQLRFKPALPNSKWRGTLNATQDKSECLQGSNPPQGSEDCLYINVYTPNPTPSLLLPVMVWIHGGGFVTGNGSYINQGPDYLLEEGVVFVQFNYRLGVFGFISTEDLVCPGNLGLKDQVLALTWVRRNIHYFGGDPLKVTIFGESAGAASVSYLLQTNLTTGLFRGAIMQSGTSLCLWALNRRATETAFSIGKFLKVNTKNSSTLIEGLREIDAKTLQNTAATVSLLIAAKNPLAGIMFGPVKEPYHEGALFYNNSEERLSEGYFRKVPTIIGFNSNESAAIGDITALMRLFLATYDIDMIKLVPADLTNNALKKLEVSTLIKKEYFGITPLSLQTGEVIVFVSDDQFNRPIIQTVRNQQKHAPVYFYEFSFEGVEGGRVNRTLQGVGHAEDLGYIFRTYHDHPTPSKDAAIRKIFVRLWTYFAKYLNPTPEKDPILQNITWLESNAISNNLSYLNIDSKLEMRLNPFNTSMKFWDRIYKKFGDGHYDTY